MKAVCSFCLILALLIPVLPAAAQEKTDPASEQEIVIGVEVDRPRRPMLAVPAPRLTRRDDVLQAAAAEFHQVLRDDLRYSGVFELLDPRLYDLVGVSSHEEFPFTDWDSVGAEWVVLVDVMSEGSFFVVEGRLFEVHVDQTMVLAKRYKAKFELVRKTAHRLSDVIVNQVSGTPGVAETRMAFVSDRVGAREIFISDYDGHQPLRITRNRAMNLSPDWSPDDQEIVYTTYVHKNPDLYIMSSHGGTNRPLFTKKGLNAAPAFSPDGSRIAFTSSHEDDTEIYVIRFDGSGLRRLTTSRGIDTGPCWSPNGREIVFTSERSGSPQLWIMDTDGLNVRRLTRSGRFNDLGNWSPKGRRIAYCAQTGGGFDIMVHDLVSGTTYQLTHGEGSNEQPTWSPDARQIAFVSNRDGKDDIYVMNDDGSNLRRITRGGNNLMPAWSRALER